MMKLNVVDEPPETRRESEMRVVVALFDQGSARHALDRSNKTGPLSAGRIRDRRDVVAVRWGRIARNAIRR
jgi:hypothetical protein